MKRKQILLGLLSITFIISCRNEKTTVNKDSKDKNTIKVETIVAMENDQNEVYNYSGIITPQVKTQLSFQVPGKLEATNVEIGDEVKKGQVLAELNKSSFESSYKAAAAMKAQAQDAYNRLKIVYEKGSLPDIQWEEIKSKLAQANAAEQIARNNLNNCSLKAPNSGVIGSRSMEIGSSVMPGISVIDLLTINDVFVKISVPENEINKIKKKQSATIIIPAISQNEYTGTVEKIGVMANQISKTYEVKIRLNNPNLIIKPGMACDVNLSINNAAQKITIPAQSVIKESDNKNYVFLINPETHSAIKQEIEIGQFSNNNLLVISGISKGDRVVVNGQHKLSADSKVVY